MPAPKGSRNALGNKGGSRKSAYDEHKDAEFLASVFNDRSEYEVVKARIDSGFFSGSDRLKYMILSGNERLVAKMMDKMLPDLHDVTTGGEKFGGLTPEQLEEYKRMFPNARSFRAPVA